MSEAASPTIAYAALRCRCPRCGKGNLYHGLLDIAESCDKCGLSFAGHEQGDGPAFFAILIVGALVATLAAIVEIKFEPPFWLQGVVWIPVIIIASLLSLRCLKAALIAAQYRIKKEDFES